MTTMIQGTQLRDITLGQQVSKAGLSIANSSVSIFTVTTGLVLITSIVGKVTTIIGGAVNLNLTHTPSGGAAADLCAATACDNDAAGTLYTISGVATDTMSVQAAAGAQVPSVTYAPNLLWGHAGGLLVPAGSIKFKGSAAQTGAVKWFATWVPYETGAALAAA